LNLLVVLLIVLGAVAAGVLLMYVVRRVAKKDHFLEDTTRGGAIFGVVGTAFAVLLAFVMFVAFQSYTNAKDAAVAEAAGVNEMFRTAQYFHPDERNAIETNLICYARAVIHRGWPAMREGATEANEAVDEWRIAIEGELQSNDLATRIEREAYTQLLEERDASAEARRQRLTESEPVVSAPVWLILGLGGLATVSFVLIFTDRREAFPVQAALMASVAAMVSASLTLVWFLDHPYQGSNGSIEPVEMEQTLQQMEAESAGARPPCTAHGVPVPA
jgi:hypothetical protein